MFAVSLWILHDGCPSAVPSAVRPLISRLSNPCFHPGAKEGDHSRTLVIPIMPCFPELTVRLSVVVDVELLTSVDPIRGRQEAHDTRMNEDTVRCGGKGGLLLLMVGTEESQNFSGFYLRVVEQLIVEQKLRAMYSQATHVPCDDTFHEPRHHDHHDQPQYQQQQQHHHRRGALLTRLRGMAATKTMMRTKMNE